MRRALLGGRAVRGALVGLAALLGALLTALVAMGGDLGSSGVSAVVRAGPAHVVRSGPSTQASPLDALPAGTSVVVDCLDGPWARLLEPSPGGYVHRSGLVPFGNPPPC
jgi:uncharacterized protein YraI